MRWLVVLLGVMSAALVSLARGDDLRSELPADVSAAKTAQEYRIVFIGNSITRHGTNAEIKERLKWDHTAGMAATSADKDYAHQLMAKMQAVLPDRKVVADFTGLPPGGKGTPEQRTAALAAKMKDTRADLVVFQHGEHEQMTLGADVMEQTYRRVLEILTGMQPRPRIICVGNWGPEKGPNYTGWGKTLNDTFARVCAEKQIPYVSVEKIGCDPACHGWGEHPGVKWHPNDQGHRRYAEEIFAAWEKAAPSNSTP